MPNFFKKDAKIIAIYGKRGSGKSYLAKQMVKNTKHLVVFDPLGEYHKEGCVPFNPVKDKKRLILYIRDNLKKGFKIAIQPDETVNYTNIWNDLWDLFKKVQQPYKDEKINRKITFLIEEMSVVIPNKNGTNILKAVQAFNLGRHWGFNVIGVSQRPPQVHCDFEGQCEEEYYFSLKSGADYKRFGDTIGREWLPTLKKLTTHHFLRCVNGKITKMKNNV